MIHNTNFLKGVFKPKEEFSKIKDAEEIKGFTWKLILLLLLNGVFAAVITYLVQKNVSIDQMLKGVENAEAMKKGILVTSTIFGGLAGAIGTLIMMAIGALIFLIFFKEVGYKKLFVVQGYLAVITAVQSLFQIPMLVLTDYKLENANFFSLGVISRSLTENGFINAFASSISIFLIWSVIVSIVALKQLSTKSPKATTWTVIGINLVFIIIGSVLTGLSQGLTNTPNM